MQPVLRVAAILYVVAYRGMEELTLGVVRSALRGRYEVQIEDSPRHDIPLPTDIGAVYGFLWPNENAATGPGRWQTFDIMLVGRLVTVLLNGHPVIADQLIPGPTGGTPSGGPLDSDEGAPGRLCSRATIARSSTATSA